MKVFETQLPGVGRRYTLSFPSGGEFVIVIHNGGRRRTYWRAEADDDSEPLFETTESQARKIAEVFDGTYFHPVEEDLDEALEDARIRWVAIDASASVAGRTIGETRLRSRTGASILAIQRGDRTVPNPGAETEIRAGDTLVVVGTADAHDALDNLLAT